MEVERLTAVIEASGLSTYRANMAAADRYTANTKDKLGSLAEISRVATSALARVKVTAAQALESEAAANRIRSVVGSVGRAAMEAADHLERVKLRSEQAAETAAVAHEIDRELKNITGNANEARRAVESVRMRGRPGVGVGPFGSGFGRMGVLGAAVGAGVLAGPAIAPAALGLLSAIPGLAASGVGALGTLVLAFKGVGKAVDGDKKAFDALTSSQQQFVLQVRSLHGWLQRLKQTAAGSMFPGLTQGLTSALSPGTLGAITSAVQGFGSAIGQAGAQWGKYFGSPQFQSLFGPLMRSGARNLGVMSDAALHLFDAIGVLGRAAIPFTNWMTDGIDKGARLASSWMHAQEASGALAHGMDEAKVSLRLVGDLIGSVFNAVGALGTALYPVSKVAVKDLTDGLNSLAGMIDRNQSKIREIVGGALRAFVGVVRDLSALVRDLTPFLRVLASVADVVANALGGWTKIIEAIIALKFGLILKDWITKLGLIGPAATVARTTTAAEMMGIEGAVAGATAKVGLLRLSLLGLGALTIAPIVIPIIKEVISSNVGKKLFLDYSGKDLLHDIGGLFRGGGGAAPSQLYSTPGPGAAAAAAAAGGGSKRYNRNSIYALLKSQGASDQEAAYLTYASTTHEDPRGDPRVVNNNPGTGDYSVGLFQINYYGKMLAARTAAFGSPAYLAGHPQAQAAAALSLLRTQGAGAWPTSSGMAGTFFGAGSNGSYGSPYSTPAPFDKNLGPKPPKPKAPPLIPAALTNAASRYANLASNLGNTGTPAKKYLEDELVVLTKEWAGLRTKLAGATDKNRDAISKAFTGVENHMRDVGRLIRDAVVTTGDALLPAKLKTRLASLQSQFAADSAWGAVMTGTPGENYAKVLRGNLRSQEAVLGKEVANLKRQLTASVGKQRTAIQAELATVKDQLSGVQDQVLQSLQGTVQALQGHVQTYFAKVQSEFQAAFEQQTQGLIDELGKKFFQNGLLTPLEQSLSSMQAADQLGGLQDSLQAARDQLAKDQNTLAAVVYEASTGITSLIYDQAGLDQVASDKKAVTAAGRQLDEYRLSIRAAEERAQADKDYAEQLKALQATRSSLENEMNSKLSALSEQFANGTGTMAALTGIASLYGLQIGSTTIPDFDNLSTASKSLVEALAELASYIASITGKTPTPIDTGSTSTGGDGTAIDYIQQAQANAEALGYAANYFMSGGSVYYQSNTGKYGKKPMLDDGGWVEKTGVAVVHAGETYSGVGAHRRGGGSMIVELTVNALDPASVDWDPIADKLRAAFTKAAKNGAANPWG